MANEVLSIILYVVCIAAFGYGIFVIRKLHKISEEAERMLKELKEETDGKWATVKQQSNNTRTNHVLEHNGQKNTLSQWAEILGVSVTTLWDRLKSGWSVERTLTEQIHNNGGNRAFSPNCGAKMADN